MGTDSKDTNQKQSQKQYEISQCTSKREKRSGAPNYSSENVNVLLNIVEDLEPIGANNWVAVLSKFKDYTKENSRSKRDIDFPRMKFDRLANQKKPTGSNACPPLVRSAKQIARDILGKVNAVSIGDDIDLLGNGSGGNVDVDTYPGQSGSSGKKPLGAQSCKQKAGAAGTKQEEDVDAFVEHVADMSKATTSLVEKRLNEEERLTIPDVQNIVKQETKAFNSSSTQLKQMVLIHFNQER